MRKHIYLRPFILIGMLASFAVQAQIGADPASRAFEEGRWQDVIVENGRILVGNPGDRLAHLRIAQAQRELGRYEDALASIERARAADGPLAMLDLERARNLLALNRHNDAIVALLDADHNALRAYGLLREHPDFDPIRDTPQFKETLRNVRARVYPCEGVPEFDQFDFWLGQWEVRTPDGALAGHNSVTREQGGCQVREQWESASGATGTSTSFYLPSRDQWRQIWVGSNGTLIDMSGQFIDGEMQMEGTIEYAERGRVVAFRANWSVNSDGSIVRQKMEEFDVANARWNLWFDGFYRKMDKR
jgi:hypothetical protein